MTIGGQNYAPGDFLVFKAARGEAGEQFGRVESLFIVEDDRSKRWLFLECRFFRILMVNGRPCGAPWHTSLQLGELQPLQANGVRLPAHILRPFTPFPEPGFTLETSPTNDVIVAPTSLGFKAKDVWIPLFPMVSSVRWLVSFWKICACGRSFLVDRLVYVARLDDGDPLLFRIVRAQTSQPIQLRPSLFDLAKPCFCKQIFAIFREVHTHLRTDR